MPSREEMIAFLNQKQLAPDARPSREQMIDFLKNKSAAPSAQPEDSLATRLTRSTLDTVLPVGGAIAAGLAATPESAGLATVPAAAAGYAGGKQLSRIAKHYLLGDPYENSGAANLAKQTGNDLIEGATMEVGGQVGSKVLEGAAPYVAKGAEKVAQAGKWSGIKVLSSLSGVKSDILKEFAADPNKYLGAANREEVTTNISKIINGINDSVSEGKIAVDDAKQVYRQYISDLKSSRSDIHKDAKESLKQGLRDLDNAYRGAFNDLKAKPAPTTLQPEISNSIRQLKEKVGQGSEESYGILENDKGAYGVRSAGKVLRDLADEMDIKPWTNTLESSGKDLAARVSHASPEMQASRPITGESRGVQNAIRSFAQMLEETPEAVPAKELKKILQQIDNSGQAQYGQPGFDSRVSQAYKLVRDTIDKGVKDKNPEYRAKMIEVAQNTGLLNKAIANFGTPEKAIGKLSSIAGSKGDLSADLLKQLGEATGKDFTTPISDYVKTQELLRNPSALAKLKAQLPESATVKDLLEKAKQAAAGADTRELVRLNKNSIENRSLNFAEENLAKAKDTKSIFTGWTEQSVDGKINSIIKGNGYVSKQLESLSKLSNKDFVSQVKALRINEAFDKSAMHGSRNVNFWTVLGAVGGAAKGGAIGGPIGAGVGAVGGALVDSYGPAMAKSILLSLSKLKGPPTMQALMGVGKLSRPVAAAVMKDFNKAIGKSNVVDNRPQKGPSKWANDGFDKIIDHADDETKSKLLNQKDQMLADKKMKDLLIQASDLSVGSRAMDKILREIDDEELE